MRKLWISRAIMTGVLILLLGTGLDAMAGMGMGGGRGRGGAYSSNLTDDQISQMAAEQQSFLKSTAGIREQLRENEVLLRAEHSKKAPDAAKITLLQNQENTLRSQFDTALQQHMVTMKKIDPNFVEGRGMGRGMGMGPGNGMGPSNGY